MFFIGGIASGQKDLDYDHSTIICSRCGSYGRYQVFMTYLYFSFFFIPLFRWKRHFYVRTSCCGSVYELNPEVGMALLKGHPVQIRETDLNLVHDGSGRNGAGGKTCPKCGYEAEESFSYCPKCGSDLNGARLDASEAR